MRTQTPFRIRLTRINDEQPVLHDDALDREATLGWSGKFDSSGLFDGARSRSFGLAGRWRKTIVPS